YAAGASSRFFRRAGSRTDALDTETGVYFRLWESHFQVGSSEKERPMGSKRPARRDFLKSGAALAGGFTLGAAAPVFGQTPASPAMIKGDKDQIAYGDRSRFVTSAR